MDDNLAIQHFRRDFIIQTLVHEKQFEQWLRFMFYLNERLKKEYDTVYQDAFYVKVFEALTLGLEYAQKVYESLLKGENDEKAFWYKKLIDGLMIIREALDDSEFLYIEYRRHVASHIFQTQYEHIQEDFKIKKTRKEHSLIEINKLLKELILKYGSDRNVDEHLNQKLQPILTSIYNGLIK